MASGVSCDVCGNEIAPAATSCPFCGARRAGSRTNGDLSLYRTVNLEKGMPTVEQALLRFRNEMSQAAREGCRVLILIHGYGSSGEGGLIRQEIRRQLQFMYDSRQINDFLRGEECDRRLGHGRHVVRRFPFVKKFLLRANPGISIVIF